MRVDTSAAACCPLSCSAAVWLSSITKMVRKSSQMYAINDHTWVWVKKERQKAKLNSVLITVLSSKHCNYRAQRKRKINKNPTPFLPACTKWGGMNELGSSRQCKVNFGEKVATNGTRSLLHCSALICSRMCQTCLFISCKRVAPLSRL